jgi:hypothetical protein
MVLIEGFESHLSEVVLQPHRLACSLVFFLLHVFLVFLISFECSVHFLVSFLHAHAAQWSGVHSGVE